MLSEFVSEIRYQVTDSLKRRLAALGLRIEIPGKLVGDSGVEHWVALSAVHPDGRTMLVDIHVSHDVVDEGPVISTYAKVLDTSPSEAYLLVMPRANLAAGELAKSYGIRLIEGISVDDLVMKFEEAFPVKAVQA